MNGRQLNELLGSTLRSPRPDIEQFERLAEALREAHSEGETDMLQHIHDRLKQIGKRTGNEFTERQFDLDTARLVIANEIGFANWNELKEKLSTLDKTILFQYAVAAMERGDFTALEERIGGPERFTGQIIEWCENGYFKDEPETLAEVFSAACMLGYARAAEYLLDKGVDPLAGKRTGLNGYHYAASSGRAAVIKLLIYREVPMEERNMYGGTVIEQALWSAINEHADGHGEIIEDLVRAGAQLEAGTFAWWNKQEVPSSETKRRVSAALLSREAS